MEQPPKETLINPDPRLPPFPLAPPEGAIKIYANIQFGNTGTFCVNQTVQVPWPCGSNPRSVSSRLLGVGVVARQGVGSYFWAGENGPCLALVTRSSAWVSSAELYRGPPNPLKPVEVTLIGPVR